jgi:hypothetical protein
MSYWVYLEGDHGEPLTVNRHSDGGTYVVGGTAGAELNITYNYSRQYSRLGFSLKEDLNGKTGAETVELLETLVGKLGTADDSNDYWEPTPGNAGKALNRLLRWARQHPYGVWRVS